MKRACNTKHGLEVNQGNEDEDQGRTSDENNGEGRTNTGKTIGRKHVDDMLR